MAAGDDVRFKIQLSALLVMMITAVLVQAPASVRADDYGQCDGDTGCEPDDHDPHEWCRSGSAWSDRTNLANIVANEMADLEAETKFNSKFQSDCDNGTDIKFLIEYDTKSWQGQYQCQDKNIWGKCDNANIWLRPKSMSTNADREQTACHEIGHAGGLTHHGSTYGDCMAATTSPSSSQLHWNSHHEDHMDNLN